MSNPFPERAIAAISKRDLVQLRQCLEEDPSQARGPARLATLSNTPLMLATFLDDPAAIDVLVAHGAEVNFLDAEGRTALIVAAMRSTRATLETLIRLGAELGIEAQDGATALIVAAQASNTEAMAVLLDAGADPRPPNRHGRSAMNPKPNADSPSNEAIAMAAQRARVLDARDAIASASSRPALPERPTPSL